MKTTFTIFASSMLLLSAVNAQKISMVQSSQTKGSLEFIPNEGQIADMKGKVRKDILYVAHAGGLQVFLKEDGLSYVINTLKTKRNTPGMEAEDDPKDELKEVFFDLRKLRNVPFKTCRVDMNFVGASQPETQNLKPTAGYINYYYPYCPDGIKKVKGYENVLYKGIYPYTDVSYKGEYSKGFEYDIIVNPGGDVNNIRMSYKGTEKAELKDGKLVFTAFTGQLEEHIPKIYQDINGTEVIVDGKYVLYHQGKDSADGTIVGFQIGNYNKAYPLVIDPWWATYCGGSSDDEGYACAIDSKGLTYAAGFTESANYPASAGAFQTALAGGEDCFIIKFDGVGQRIWATYYGGSTTDAAYGITTDYQDNVLITGNTSSSDFPVSAGCFQSASGGGEDGFIVKLDQNGARLWATYVGGASADQSNFIATDPKGNIAIDGFTESANFPVSAGCFQSAKGAGTYNAFVAEFDPNGVRLWATYFGGNGASAIANEWESATPGDDGLGVGCDANGNVAFAGATSSTNLPVTAGLFQKVSDVGFIGEFDKNGNQLWTTYFGGQINGLSVDKSSNVVVSGFAGDMVATAGVYQTARATPWANNGSVSEGFAAKFNSIGGEVWATFNNTGQSELSGDLGMCTDDGNNVYIEDDEETGEGAESGFPTGSTCGYERTNSTEENMYVVKLDSNGHYSCSTYLGGTLYNEHEYLSQNLAARGGRLALTAWTEGDIHTTPGCFQPDSAGGSYDAYVFNVCSFSCGDTTAAALNIKAITVNNDSCGHVNFRATASSPCDSGGAVFTWKFPGGTPSTGSGNTVNGILYTSPGTYNVTLTYIACALDSITQQITISAKYLHVSVNNNVVNETCLGASNGSANVTVGGGASPYTYSWSSGGGTDSAASGLSAGTYTVTAMDVNGCVVTASVNITQPQALAATTKPTNVLCNGQSNGQATVTVKNGTTPYTYSWSVGGTASTGTGMTAGTYSVSITDNNGCTASATVTITQPALLTATMGKPVNELCNGGNGGSAVVTAAGGTMTYTYAWSPSGGSGATGSALMAGTYTVTVTDIRGCTATASVAITQPIALTSSMGAPVNEVCYGGNNGSAMVTAGNGTAPYSYSWVPAGGTNATGTGLSAGSFTVTVTDVNGCTTTSSVSLTQPTQLVATIGNILGVQCNGGANGGASVTASGGISPYTYKWAPGGGNGSSTKVLIAGSYTVTVTDANRCTATASVIITQPVVLTASMGIPNNVLCKSNSGSVTVTAAGGTPAYTYAWSPKGGTNATGTGLSAGNYTVTITDMNGCRATSSATITNNGKGVTINLSPNDTVCTGNSVTLAPAVSGGTVPYTYSWTPNTNLSCTGCLSPIASPTVAVCYNLTVNDSNGCTATAQACVTVNSATASLSVQSSDSICNTAGTITLFGSPNGGVYSGNAVYGRFFYPDSAKTGVFDYQYYTVVSNGCTAVGIDSLFVNKCDTLTGINGVQSKNGSLTVFPNPTNGALTIQWQSGSGKLFVEIYNVLGQNIYSAPAPNGNNMKIALDKAAAGMYLCRVIKESGELVGEVKFVIER